MKIIRRLICLLSIFLFIQPVSVQAKNSFFIGGSTQYNKVSDKFDGDRGFVVSSTSTYAGFFVGSKATSIIVPKVEPGLAVGIVVGWQGPGGEIDFSYHNSHTSALGAKHDVINNKVTVLIDQVDVDYNVYDMDMKLWFRKKGFVRPFGGFGIGYHSISAEHGSVVANNKGEIEVGDAVFTGVAWNFDLGLTLIPHKHVSLNVGAVMRFLTFDTVKGPLNTSIDLENKQLKNEKLFIKSHGLNYFANAKFVF